MNSKEWEIVRLRRKGASYRVIATAVGMSHTTVATVLKRVGPSLRGRRARRKVSNHRLIRRAVELRRTMTYSEIARELGIGRQRAMMLVRGAMPNAVGSAVAPCFPWGTDMAARNAEIVAMKRAGFTHAQIAEKFKLSASGVAGVLRRRAPELIRSSDLAARDEEVLKALARGTVHARIAEAFGMSVENVRRIKRKGQRR